MRQRRGADDRELTRPQRVSADAQKCSLVCDHALPVLQNHVAMGIVEIPVVGLHQMPPAVTRWLLVVSPTTRRNRTVALTRQDRSWCPKVVKLIQPHLPSGQQLFFVHQVFNDHILRVVEGMAVRVWKYVEWRVVPQNKAPACQRIGLNRRLGQRQALLHRHHRLLLVLIQRPFHYSGAAVDILFVLNSKPARAVEETGSPTFQQSVHHVYVIDHQV